MKNQPIRSKMGKKFGVSFSLSRLVGLSAAKQKIARKTGIPTTKIGMNAKIGRTLIKLLTGK